MLRDASHQQVIEKFSFIYTLTLSSAIDSTEEQVAEELTIDRYQFLERSSSLVNTSVKLKQQDKITSNPSSLVASSASVSESNVQSDQQDSTSNFSDLIKFSEADTINTLIERKPNYLGKILFVLSCGYLILVLSWLFSNQSGKIFAMLRGKQQISLSKSDAEFIDYIERSLATIDRNAQTSKTQENNAQSESQVVYVPVYTPASPTPTPPQLSATTIPEPTPIPPPPPPTVAKIPAPPSLPESKPVTQAPAPQQAEPVVATAISQPAIKHTLIGILELGDKSAALFKVRGTTKRIWLGEEIDNSGWILESISNQTVKISYQGEMRSLSVGETF